MTILNVLETVADRVGEGNWRLKMDGQGILLSLSYLNQNSQNFRIFRMFWFLNILEIQ
ncbi:MAG: hypothetical protein R3E08_09930 [Thiotrichaceae bacterium]